jgi:hypothetical protein
MSLRTDIKIVVYLEPYSKKHTELSLCLIKHNIVKTWGKEA